MPKVPKITSSQCFKENVKDEVSADKHRFLQNDTIILVVWPGMPKLPKITSLEGAEMLEKMFS